jgi:hypothetical protein
MRITSTTCWSGAVVSGVDQCWRPSNEAEIYTYLRYVYPSMDTQPGCTKETAAAAQGYSGITAMYDCELGEALIRYRYWQNPADAEKHYEKKFRDGSLLRAYPVLIGGTATKGWVKTDKKTVSGPGGVRRVVLTMWLPEQQLSLSVEANNTDAMWAALKLARIRPAAQALSHPTGQNPAEAAISVS